MIAVKGNKNYGHRVIISCNPEQKNTHEIQTPNGKISLYLAKKYNENGRESNPVMGRVISSSEKLLKTDDIVICHHNAILKDMCMDDKYGAEKTEKLYSIQFSLVFLYIRDGVINPIYPYAVAQRIYFPERTTPSGIILNANPEQVKNRLKIIKKPPEETEIQEGDIVFVYDKSDYEVVYNDGKREKRIITTNIERDIMGVDVDFDIENYILL